MITIIFQWVQHHIRSWRPSKSLVSDRKREQKTRKYAEKRNISDENANKFCIFMHKFSWINIFSGGLEPLKKKKWTKIQEYNSAFFSSWRLMYSYSFSTNLPALYLEGWQNGTICYYKQYYGRLSALIAYGQRTFIGEIGKIVSYQITMINNF